MKKFEYGKAICYSGYREGQNPHIKLYPDYDEIKEDLLLLEKEWRYIRLYDPSVHAQIVLKVIEDNSIDLKVMLGVDLLGEESNPNCSWGGDYTIEEIVSNTKANSSSIQDAILLANKYPEIVFAVSAGNEAVPEWNENLVQPTKILEYVIRIKNNVKQPVTYCENVAYWPEVLSEVAKEVDFISIHTYAAWAGYSIDDAMDISVSDFEKVQNAYPDKYCIITEAGWPTRSGGKGIKLENVGEDKQEKYFYEIHKWSEENNTLVFFFEAFDEPWKGGENPEEPEKNWGIFDVNRKPKKVLKR